MTESRKLRVFLCHASQDKPIVRELYQRLFAEGWIDPWLDEEKLLPGHDWSFEIEKAVRDADVVIVFLSNNSVDKRGFVQKELKFALDVALEIPEGSIFIIPLRLDGCEIPIRLSRWQWIDYFPKAQSRQAYKRLLKSLDLRAATLGIQVIELKPSAEYTAGGHQIYKIGGFDFVRVPSGKFLMGSYYIQDAHPQHLVDIPYTYWIGRFTITNSALGNSSNQMENKPFYPAVQVSWYEAQEFLLRMRNEHRAQLPRGLDFRLPSEAEWEKASRGPDGRLWPWGNRFVLNICNTLENQHHKITPVGEYLPFGESPFGASDMAGNIWEWTRTLWGEDNTRAEYKYPYRYNDGREDERAPSSCLRIIRGGSFMDGRRFAHCAFRRRRDPRINHKYLGFRIAIVPTSL